MSTVMNVGLIQYKDLATPYNKVYSNDESNNFHIKKILVKGNVVSNDKFPHAEIVQDSNAIINDGSIDLVIVCSPNEEGMNLVTEALNAGKSVRIL
jgi:hypothetical protein